MEDTTVVLQKHGVVSGGGGGAGGAGGIGPQRMPQSAQSVPYGQSAHSAPGPPSSHNPSELCTLMFVLTPWQVLWHVQPGGGGGGDGGCKGGGEGDGGMEGGGDGGGDGGGG